LKAGRNYRRCRRPFGKDIHATWLSVAPQLDPRLHSLILPGAAIINEMMANNAHSRTPATHECSHYCALGTFVQI
jgi:hypothetical protein